MWFPRRQILVEVFLQHSGKFKNSDPKVFCKSGLESLVSSNAEGNLQRLSIEVEAPDQFLIDATNTESTGCHISKVTMDGIEINTENMQKVFKIAINKNNLPVSFDNVQNYQMKVGDRLSKHSYMLFDIWANDSITYLLSIGNKINW
jgi:hypothetical protein